VRLAVWFLIGLAGLGLSWFRISGEGDWHDQLPWLVVGVVVLAISGLGTAGWLMAASRVVHLEAHDVMSQLRRQQLEFGGLDVPAMEADLPAPVPVPHPDAGGAVVYVSGPGMTRVHASTCLLVVGKAVSPVDGAEVAARGLQPCGVCCG
jgi:hypothetical protein